MRVISREALQALRERYPKGARVELVQMDDPQAPPIGTKGTVIGVDDIGSVMVAWDTGYIIISKKIYIIQPVQNRAGKELQESEGSYIP